MVDQQYVCGHMASSCQLTVCSSHVSQLAWAVTTHLMQALCSLSQVYVILFGVGSTDTEGIYSLRVMSRDDGLPQDTIIAFSCKEDADRCAAAPRISEYCCTAVSRWVLHLIQGVMC
jgi:Protein of unknown function (DUF3110)